MLKLTFQVIGGYLCENPCTPEGWLFSLEALLHPVQRQDVAAIRGEKHVQLVANGESEEQAVESGAGSFVNLDKDDTSDGISQPSPVTDVPLEPAGLLVFDQQLFLQITGRPQPRLLRLSSFVTSGGGDLAVTEVWFPPEQTQGLCPRQLRSFQS